MNEQHSTVSEPATDQDPAPVILPLDQSLLALVGGGGGLIIL